MLTDRKMYCPIETFGLQYNVIPMSKQTCNTFLFLDQSLLSLQDMDVGKKMHNLVIKRLTFFLSHGLGNAFLFLADRDGDFDAVLFSSYSGGYVFSVQRRCIHQFCIEVIHSVNIVYFLSGKRRRSRSLLLGGQRFGFLSIQNDITISCFVHNTARVLFFCSQPTCCTC